MEMKQREREREIRDVLKTVKNSGRSRLWEPSVHWRPRFCHKYLGLVIAVHLSSFIFFGLIEILALLFFNFLWICSSILKSDHFDHQYIFEL